MLHPLIRVLRTPHLLGQIALDEPNTREVITGYESHQTRIRQMTICGRQADALLRIHHMAEEFIGRIGTVDAIREIQVIGHSDRVFRNGLRLTVDEEQVSLERAQDVWRELNLQIFTFNALHITPARISQMLQAAFRSGDLRALVISAGAWKPITNVIPGPENRRVEIRLLTTQSTPI